MQLPLLGETDCEAIGDGILHQPVNALTSLFFSGFGVLVLATASAVAGLERRMRLVFGSLMVATGIGSFLYHGPQWTGSLFIHDITFLATVWVLAAVNFAAVTGRSEQRGWIAAGTGVVVAAGLLIVFPTGTNLLTGAAVVALVASDILAHGTRGVAAGWYGLAVVMLGLALVANIVGRTGAPACDPGSLLQLHGAWHVLAGGALTAYLFATVPSRLDARQAVLS